MHIKAQLEFVFVTGNVTFGFYRLIGVDNRHCYLLNQRDKKDKKNELVLFEFCH